MEKWLLKNIKADFKKMSEELGVSELICRLLVNRHVSDYNSAVSFINPNLQGLHNPRLMKDLEKGVGIIKNKIIQGKRIRIVGDYDVDGVISTYLLFRALSICNAEVDYDIPHRVFDGYGINKNIIEKARDEGIDTIITCDNGISAIEQIKYAKELGLTVIVTDHHEVTFVENTDGTRHYIIPDADAVIDNKQKECDYPFKNLCGAAVAFKFIQVLFEEMSIPQEEALQLIEFVAIATVCDVVDLIGENRILVKMGLETIDETQNIGLKALFHQTGIEGKTMNVYFLGFIIGPCINASGRMDCAKRGLRLLLSEDIDEADKLAHELYILNNERKDMTIKGVENIIQMIENTGIKNDRVFVIYKQDIHESIAGIIASKIREKYNVPVIVLTDGDQGVKGSGRSIEEYNMFEELLKCKELLLKFGGHPMAAGMSLEAKNIEMLRERLNTQTSLTSEDLARKLNIDLHLPIDKINMAITEELELLEPYGKGNPKPLFAERNVSVSKASILGVNKNVLKLWLVSENGKKINSVYFGDIQSFREMIAVKYGQAEYDKILNGLPNQIKLDILYNLEINEYGGNRSVQLIIQYFR